MPAKVNAKAKPQSGVVSKPVSAGRKDEGFYKSLPANTADHLSMAIMFMTDMLDAVVRWFNADCYILPCLAVCTRPAFVCRNMPDEAIIFRISSIQSESTQSVNLHAFVSQLYTHQTSYFWVC